MKFTILDLHKRRAREKRSRLLAGAALALAYSAVILGPFALLAG